MNAVGMSSGGIGGRLSRIEFDQRLASRYLLAIVNMDSAHHSSNRWLHHLDVGVRNQLAIGDYHNVELAQGCDQQNQQHQGDDNPHGPARRWMYWRFHQLQMRRQEGGLMPMA